MSETKNYNINLTADEINRRLTFGTHMKSSLGELNNTADLKSALLDWAHSNYQTVNASTTFSANRKWISEWESGTSEIQKGDRMLWTVTIIACYPNTSSANTYGQLRIASPYYSTNENHYETEIYTVKFTPEGFGSLHKVAFSDEVANEITDLTTKTIKPIDDRTSVLETKVKNIQNGYIKDGNYTLHQNLDVETADPKGSNSFFVNTQGRYDVNIYSGSQYVYADDSGNNKVDDIPKDNRLARLRLSNNLYKKNDKGNLEHRKWFGIQAYYNLEGSEKKPIHTDEWAGILTNKQLNNKGR